MNVRERLRGSKKVTAMVEYLWSRMSDAERLDPDFVARYLRRSGNGWRDAIAKGAKVRTPSLITWDAMCGRIAERIDAGIMRVESLRGGGAVPAHHGKADLPPANNRYPSPPPTPEA